MNNKEWLEEIKNGYFECVLGTPWVSMPKERLDWLIQQVEQLEKENKRYREALGFYVDNENYEPEHYDPDTHDYTSIIDHDKGATARKALEGLK